MSSPLKYLTLLFLLFSISGIAQNILVLEKASRRKSFQFREGDRIKVFLQPDSIFVSGRIAYITDSAIVFERNGFAAPVSQIQVAYTKRWGFGYLSKLFLKAGIGYAIVGGANQVISGKQNDLFRYPLLIGGGLVAVSFLIKPLAIRKHKIYNHNWRVIILDFTD